MRDVSGFVTDGDHCVAITLDLFRLNNSRKLLKWNDNPHKRITIDIHFDCRKALSQHEKSPLS